MTVFANVFLGMQLALSSYLQVCFSITNDVVMSISLMFEKPESGMYLFVQRSYLVVLTTCTMQTSCSGRPAMLGLTD